MRKGSHQPQGSLGDQELCYLRRGHAQSAKQRPASLGQQRRCGWLKLSCFLEGGEARAGCPEPSCSLAAPPPPPPPRHTCMTHVWPFLLLLLPCPMPLGPTRQYPLIVQMGKLKSGENGAAQATQQVSSRATTETRPRFHSPSPLPATSAPPPSVTAGGSTPSRPGGEAQGCSPAHVGYTQDPGSQGLGAGPSFYSQLFPGSCPRDPGQLPTPLRASVSPAVKHMR